MGDVPITGATPNAASVSSTWPGRHGPAAHPWPPASWASTCSTPSSPSTRPITEDQVVPVDSRVDRVPLVADDFDPFTATL